MEKANNSFTFTFKLCSNPGANPCKCQPENLPRCFLTGYGTPLSFLLLAAIRAKLIGPYSYDGLTHRDSSTWAIPKICQPRKNYRRHRSEGHRSLQWSGCHKQAIERESHYMELPVLKSRIGLILCISDPH